MASGVEAISERDADWGAWTCHWPSIDEKNSFSPQARTDSVEKFVRSRIPNMKCAPAATRCAVLNTNSCTLPCTHRRQHPTFEPAHTQGERQQVLGKLGRTGRGTRGLDPNPRTAAARGSTARLVCPAGATPIRMPPFHWPSGPFAMAVFLGCDTHKGG